MEEEAGMAQALIPGLDDESALLCLARVPLAYHKTVRSVCRSWKALLDFPMGCSSSVASDLTADSLASSPGCARELPGNSAGGFRGGGNYNTTNTNTNNSIISSSNSNISFNSSRVNLDSPYFIPTPGGSFSSVDEFQLEPHDIHASLPDLIKDMPVPAKDTRGMPVADRDTGGMPVADRDTGGTAVADRDTEGMPVASSDTRGIADEAAGGLAQLLGMFNRGRGTSLHTPVVTPVGTPKGTPKGTPVGTPVGIAMGIPVGAPVGTPVGIPMGIPVGAPVGIPMGMPVGPPVGTPMGMPVDTAVAVSVATRDNGPVQPGELYRLRLREGVAETWIYVRTRTSVFVNNWRYFDVTNGFWSPKLPEIPYIPAAVAARARRGGHACTEGPVSNMNKVRGLASAAVGPRVFVFGGWREGGPALRDVFCYDPISERWSRRASMRSPRCYMATAVVGKRIYVAGGMSRPRLHQSELLRSVEVYDTETDVWSLLREMPFAMFFSCAAAIGGEVYVSGSRPPLDNGPPGRGCIFDPVGNTWRVFHDKRLGEAMLSPCTSVGQWLFTPSSTHAPDCVMSAWNKGTEEWCTVPIVQQGDAVPCGGVGVQGDGGRRALRPRGGESEMATFLIGPRTFGARRGGGGGRTSEDEDSEQILWSTALKDCVFMGHLELTTGWRLILLHRNGAITSVDVDFGGSPGAPSTSLAASRLASSSSSVQQNVQGFGSLHLEHQPKVGVVPVLRNATCVSVGRPLDDEQPVDMAIVTL